MEMTALPYSRLDVELALKSEIEQIREDENWFHVGDVSISRKHPTFSVGFAQESAATNRDATTLDANAS